MGNRGDAGAICCGGPVKVACEDLAEVVVAFGEYVFHGCQMRKKDTQRFEPSSLLRNSPRPYHRGGPVDDRTGTNAP